MKDYKESKRSARSVLISRLVGEVYKELHEETGVPINLAEKQEPWVTLMLKLYFRAHPEPEIDDRTGWQRFRDWLRDCPLRGSGMVL
jgi:hypothetical protein